MCVDLRDSKGWNFSTRMENFRLHNKCTREYNWQELAGLGRGKNWQELEGLGSRIGRKESAEEIIWHNSYPSGWPDGGGGGGVMNDCIKKGGAN